MHPFLWQGVDADRAAYDLERGGGGRGGGGGGGGGGGVRKEGGKWVDGRYVSAYDAAQQECAPGGRQCAPGREFLPFWCPWWGEEIPCEAAAPLRVSSEPKTLNSWRPDCKKNGAIYADTRL